MTQDIWNTTQTAALDDGAAGQQPRSPLLDAKVMMVDDEPLMTELIQAHLEDAGYRNFVATNDPRSALAPGRVEALLRIVHDEEAGVAARQLVADVRRRPLAEVGQPRADDPDAVLVEAGRGGAEVELPGEPARDGVGAADARGGTGVCQ